jgi:uncharacterized membrane protein (UPF0127 family)
MKSKIFGNNTKIMKTENTIITILLFAIGITLFTLSGCNKEQINPASKINNSKSTNLPGNQSNNQSSSGSTQLLEVCIEQTCFEAEIADSPKERAKGLMFREKLEEDKGMLFVYPEERTYNFWMKNTLIPLDIIWISADKRIVHIEEAMPCEEEPCKIYSPEKEAQFILEIKGGMAEKKGIEIGDEAGFNLNI